MNDFQNTVGTSGRNIVCCFTGHRHIPDGIIPQLTNVLENTISSLYKEGYRIFVCGGALGFDTLAAQTVLKVSTRISSVKLFLALPCRNQTERWQTSAHFDATQAIREYQRIKGLADCVVYVNDFATDTCMKERNQYMVDHSSVCIAYCKPGVFRSGTAQTVRMAEKAGLRVINTYDMLLPDCRE